VPAAALPDERARPREPARTPEIIFPPPRSLHQYAAG